MEIEAPDLLELEQLCDFAETRLNELSADTEEGPPSDWEQGCLYADVMGEIGEFDLNAARCFAEDHPNKANNNIANLIVEKVKDRDEFKLFDVLKELADDGALRNLDDKLDEEDGKRNLTFMTPWHELVVIMRAFFGFEDASTEIGHMRRRKA